MFFDGIFTEPQLNHPECIAFDQEGHVWCGGERGEIFRIDANGQSIRQIATTSGFVLGIAFDSAGQLYICDLKHAAVFKLSADRQELVRFAGGDGSIRIPNFPVVDEKRGRLYVSDSYDSNEAGPGIWSFDLQTGEGELWYREPMRFANGMALAADGSCLYVAETFGRQISRIPILADGRPGEKELVVRVDALPDGLALDGDGRLYISCYEPSMIYRHSQEGGLELLYYDPEAHTLCHPTNCAVRGQDVYTANLGRWHITKIINAVT
ncbi:gluconolaconase [Paenibacillus montanisoli]|uniref:Gluconolaconase n=2 Tax=Paenibacillus montanisoli TaxID=2081970 RepID=A0A328U0C0_9BACL|nr:gluconolaconase [Paenibacillus montanisoli]